jgi:hypothetical protein
MSIIRPFRADDLFKFNNVLRAPIPNLRARVLMIHPLETSTSGPKRCASENPRSPPFHANLLFTVWPGLLFQLSFPLA